MLLGRLSGSCCGAGDLLLRRTGWFRPLSGLWVPHGYLSTSGVQ